MIEFQYLFCCIMVYYEKKPIIIKLILNYTVVWFIH